MSKILFRQKRGFPMFMRARTWCASSRAVCHTRASAYAAHRLRRARSCAGRWRLDGDRTLTTFHEP